MYVIFRPYLSEKMSRRNLPGGKQEREYRLEQENLREAESVFAVKKDKNRKVQHAAEERLDEDDGAQVAVEVGGWGNGG